MCEIRLYSKNGELLQFDKFSPVKKGTRSDIYRSIDDNKTGLRIYHAEGPMIKTIREDHFNAIKEFKQEALPALDEVYYKTNNITPFDPVMAYTFESIEKSVLDLSDEDILYEKIVRRIISASNALAENGFSLSNPLPGDVVNGANGAYLIDPNKIIKEHKLPIEELKRINQIMALKYIKFSIISNYSQASKSKTVVSNIPTLEKTLEKANKMSA